MDPQDRRCAAALAPASNFTGYLSGSELADVYAAADVFVFPSDTETLGNVVLEAMASGLPVVAPGWGGVLESVLPGETGLLVPRGEVRAFAEAVLRLLREPMLRARLGARARSDALTRSWSASIDALLAYYDAVIVSRRSSAAAHKDTPAQSG